MDLLAGYSGCGRLLYGKGLRWRVPIYPREVVAEVLAANDIIQVVGAHVELKNAGGGRMKALCPFHREKTPSFTVTQDRQMYHCFGCGKSGDAIAFVMEHEGLHFTEALQQLADRGNVRLPAATEASQDRDGLRIQLLDFNKSASRFYRSVLNHPTRGKKGRAYLETRSLNDDTIEKFALGAVPDDWHLLYEAARKKGTPEDVLNGSGLVKQGEKGNYYDTFRDRLIFPIKDVSGNVVAFGGRDLGDSPAKYINSPETQVYRKSKVLYGLHEARDAMRREKFVILVEGYFDALRCFDSGIDNVVATCGTALTPEQASLIRRYVPEVVLVYDGDAAGIKAAMKGTGVLTAAGLAVRGLALPEGQDPDDYVLREGADALRAQLANAPDFVTFYARQSEDRLGSIEGATAVAHELFEILRHIDDEVRLDEYLRLTARELKLNERACRTEYERFTTQGSRFVRPPSDMEEEEIPSVAYTKDDRDFVASVLNDTALLEKAREALGDCTLASGDAVIEVLSAMLGGEIRSMTLDFKTEEARSLYGAAGAADIETIKDPAAVVELRLKRLKREALRTQVANLMNELQEAERSQDMGRVVELLQQKTQLGKELERVGAS
jgi:DNA primase